MCVLYSGNVYIADCSNARVRTVTISTGIISLIAGTGASSYSGDNGPATSAGMTHPSGIAVDASGITHSCSYEYHSDIFMYKRKYLHR